MSTVTINGVTYQGNNISINGSKVRVDGKDVTPDQTTISIIVAGNIQSLVVDACQQLEVSGDAGSITTMSGDVRLGGNVTGDIETMSGDVWCGNVGGKINTMSGDINTFPRAALPSDSSFNGKAGMGGSGG